MTLIIGGCSKSQERITNPAPVSTEKKGTVFGKCFGKYEGYYNIVTEGAIELIPSILVVATVGAVINACYGLFRVTKPEKKKYVKIELKDIKELTNTTNRLLNLVVKYLKGSYDYELNLNPEDEYPQIEVFNEDINDIKFIGSIPKI